MEILYKELETLIKENNETYFKLNNLVYEEEQKLPENFEYSKLSELKFQRWQFIHNYAEKMSNFILNNIKEISKKELPLFDLVPYIVWNKIPEKPIIIIRNL